MSPLDRAHHIRNLVLFADSFAIPASSVLAYRKYAPRARHRPRSLSAKITTFLIWWALSRRCNGSCFWFVVLFFSWCFLDGALKTAGGRGLRGDGLISLICAGWLPHDLISSWASSV